MKCEKRRDLILLDSIGALDRTTHEEVRAHLATGCATCAGYLAEADGARRGRRDPGVVGQYLHKLNSLFY